MEERLLELFAEINEEILIYEGDNMVEDGILDSFQIMDLVTDIEDELDIEIDAKYVIEENFRTKQTIFELIKLVMEQQ